MIKPQVSSGEGYSAEVHLWLETDEGRIDLAQIGHDFVIAAGDANVPAATRGWVVASVDGREERLPYIIVDGLRPGQSRSLAVYCDGDDLPF